MYTVINPIISSSHKSVVKEVDDLTAAQKLYAMMSESFDGNNQNFAFTVQKLKAKNEIGKGKVENYKTYVVQEKRGTNNSNAIKLELTEKKTNKAAVKDLQKNFANTVKLIKQNKNMKGGRGHDDDLFDNDDDLFNSDSNSDDEDWLYDIYSHDKYRREGSIYNWWYYPWAYNNIIPLNYINIPTFKLKYQPYVRILSPLSLITIP